MAKKTASDILVESLIDWGVQVVFGMPGDGINGIMEALRKTQDHIRFVQVRHEETAALAACGYAKFTGKLGVCLATSGPGGIHLLNGLYDAKLDGQPVLAITGHTYHDLIGTHYQQDVDLDRVFSDVAVFSQRIMSATHTHAMANLACRYAITRRGVAHLNFPLDLQEELYDEGEHSKKSIPGHAAGATMAAAIQVPPSSEVQRAADILNRSTKVAILAGRGALGATDELELLADVLAAPIIKAYLGKGAVPDDSAFTTGGIGLLGTRPSEIALEQCDALLMVGTSFPYMEYLPDHDQAVGIQIDADPTRIGLRYPVEVGLAGDAKATIDLLLPLLQRKSERQFLEQAQAGMQAWWAILNERATNDAMPLKPQVVATQLNRRLADNAIITGDSGTSTTWLARYVKVRRGQMVSGSGTLATMASGLPYAIAAQVAYPERQVVAIMGDGGFSMLMAEFATAVKYQLPIKVIIFKNNTLGQIKWEQMVFLGNPEYGCELQPIDFVKVAQACGGSGFHIEQPGEVGDILDRALSTAGPVVIEAVIDPFEPPMPAQVKPDQAMKMAQALARGEPNREQIAATLFRNKLTDLTVPSGNGNKVVEGVKNTLRKITGEDE